MWEEKGSQRKAAELGAQPMRRQERRDSANRRQASCFQTPLHVFLWPPGSMLCIIQIPRGHVGTCSQRSESCQKPTSWGCLTEAHTSYICICMDHVIWVKVPRLQRYYFVCQCNDEHDDDHGRRWCLFSISTMIHHWTMERKLINEMILGGQPRGGVGWQLRQN